MGLIVTLILGGLAGWIASMLLNRDAEQGVLLNIVVGIVGAFVANVLLTPLVGEKASLNSFTLTGFLMAVAGAVVLLAVVNLVTRKKIR